MEKKNEYEWGTFDSGRDGRVHAVPVVVHTDGRRTVKPPHILCMDCPCGPKKDYWDEDLVIHNTEH